MKPDLVGVEFRDMRISLRGHGLALRHPLHSAFVPEHVGGATRQMLYELFCACTELSHDKKLAGGYVQKSGLDLASHESILKIIIYNVSSGWLDGKNADINLLVGA
uniref:Uncharacterized protein n=1 Tax=Bionectria ochroleuca TaxID=29856 RepID=A0A8H7NA72_BIOOC